MGTATTAALAIGCDRGTGAFAAITHRFGSSRRERAERAYQMRCEIARAQRDQPLPLDSTNGDEARHSTPFASYAKGLPHLDRGEVDPEAYAALLASLATGPGRVLNQIPMGGTLRQANPEAAFTFSLCGADSHHCGIPAPPAFASAGAAADLAELYWHAIARDVPFAEYDSSPTIAAACRDLSRFSAFQGPTEDGIVTSRTLFRGSTPADLAGPFVSQFLLSPIPHGVYTIEQQFQTAAPGVNYMTDPMEWLAIQRGSEAFRSVVLDRERRYIRTGRDLARYVHRDYSYQTFLNAALLLLRFGDYYIAPNPYVQRACSTTVDGRPATEASFATFGAPHILDAVAAVANLAMLAAWRQKWLLHRRLRPEVFAQRVHASVNGTAEYPIHADLLGSAVREHLAPGNMLLPQAYPEGSPAHPSYPAAHAVVAGACATVLKAFFLEDAPFPAPVTASADGLSLLPCGDRDLTVGGELAKLASNIAIARNFAGIHYRSDMSAGLQLGEAVGLAYLADIRQCLTEPFDGFVLTTFAGEPVVV